MKNPVRTNVMGSNQLTGGICRTRRVAPERRLQFWTTDHQGMLRAWNWEFHRAKGAVEGKLRRGQRADVRNKKIPLSFFNNGPGFR